MHHARSVCSSRTWTGSTGRELGATKRDLVEYYRTLAPVLLPHLKDRPFTLKQHYTVPRGPYRYVKDAPQELPPVVKRCPQPAKSRQGAIVDYAMINNLTSLLWMVELGAVDLHVWPSRCDRPESPDYVLFDIDADRTRDAVDAARRRRRPSTSSGSTATCGRAAARVSTC